MHKGGSVGRKRSRRKEHRRILIVTEGDVTERQYFEGLLQHLRSSGVRVASSTVKTAGGEPSLVLKKARDLRREIAGEEDFDSVWIVVDVDDHAKLEEVLRECSRSDELAAVSNPQFEIWLLWHLAKSAKSHTKTTIARELEKHGFGLVKKKHLPANFPFSMVHVALEYASQGSRTSPPNVRGANPSSGLPHLVKLIQQE